MIGAVTLFVISECPQQENPPSRRCRAAIERGVCVPGDAIRAMIASGRIDMRPDAEKEALRQLALPIRRALSVARVFSTAGFDVVVEDVIIGPILRDFLPWSGA